MYKQKSSDNAAEISRCRSAAFFFISPACELSTLSVFSLSKMVEGVFIEQLQKIWRILWIKKIAMMICMYLLPCWLSHELRSA